MALDTFANFARGTLSAGLAAGATSVSLTAGHGARMPAGAANYVIWNLTDHTDPSDDTDKEIVRGTISSDTLTSITRAQEGTADVNHNTGGKTYGIMATWTAKSINTDLAATFSPILTGTANQIIKTGAVLSTPQNLHTSATFQAATLGLGAAIQRSSLFEVKEATADALTAGAAYAAITHKVNGTGLSILDTDFSTDLGDGLTLSQNGSGVATMATGHGGLLSSTAGLSMQLDYANDAFTWWWGTPGTNSVVHFGTTGIQTNIRITSLLGTHPSQGANYFNGVWRVDATDGAGNSVMTGEFGHEGNWTDAGGFTERRHYLWDHDPTIPTDLGRTIWYWQKSTEDLFVIGGDARRLDLHVPVGRLLVDGLPISTHVDGDVASGNFLSTFTKNDTNVRYFPVVQILPTFNFGGSNTNTSVDVLAINTVNTSTTGATINLIRAMSAGALRHSVDTLGNVNYVTESAATVAFTNYSADALPYSFHIRKYRGTIAARRRVQASDEVSSIVAQGGYAVDDSTTASAAANVSNFRTRAKAAFTASSRPTQFEMATPATGATSLTVRSITDENGITLGTALAARATTNPTNALTLIDGVAPVGTATNAVSLYSAAGEFRVADALGIVSRPSRPNGKVSAHASGAAMP